MSKNKSNWKDNPTREMLYQDIMEGHILPTMKPLEARKTRPEYLLMENSLFASRLRTMRNNVATGTSMAAPKKHGTIKAAPTKGEKEPIWNKNNQVRTLLKKDMSNGTIPADMDYSAAQELREEYKIMDAAKWKSRFIAMRQIVGKAFARAEEDELDLANDRFFHPWSTVNYRGEPEWAGSDAETLLEIDVQEGKSRLMAPDKLHKSRLQYQEFPLEVFRGHIYQEEQTQKWKKQWVNGKKEYTVVLPPP